MVQCNTPVPQFVYRMIHHTLFSQDVVLTVNGNIQYLQQSCGSHQALLEMEGSSKCLDIHEIPMGMMD